MDDEIRDPIPPGAAEDAPAIPADEICACGRPIDHCPPVSARCGVCKRTARLHGGRAAYIIHESTCPEGSR